MDFIAIDFETANNLRSSVCSVGIVQVKNGKIYREIQSLINPLSEFHYYNTKIHGITEHMVHDAPTFEEFWPNMKNLIEGQVIIAHNASFDMGVLQECLRQFHEPSPHFEYGCSFRIAKKVWPQLYNHKLSTVSNYLGISLRHHDALEDARAAAIITLEALQRTQTSTVKQLAKLHNVTIKSSIQAKKKPAQRKNKADMTIEFLKPEDAELNSKHPFYEAQIVFTGRMHSMTRTKAAQLAVNCGAVCKGAVDHQTNYLVVGDN
ncbi:MAG: exonuclease domain-containing protein, partial [Psychrobacillus psychrotolerans]